MPDVRITDPADLTPDERRLARQLAELPGPMFTTVVGAWVTHPDDVTRRALYSPDLAQDTLTALGVIHAETQRAASAAPAKSRQRRLELARLRMIADLRDELRPFVSLAAAGAAVKTTRARAEEILGRVHYDELRAIMRDLDDGHPAKEAFDRAKARTG